MQNRKDIETMKKIISLSLFLALVLMAMPINAFASSSNISNFIDVASEDQHAEKMDSDFSSFVLVNLDGFKRYLKSIEIDVNTPEGFAYIDGNLSTLYNAALANGCISYYPNDILLADGNVVVEDVDNNVNARWSSGDTFGVSNSSTHQVITRDALEAVESFFPGFFIKTSSGIYVTQIYAEYPDTYEKGPLGLFSWHFYNYETGMNYLANYIDNKTAKYLFF